MKVAEFAVVVVRFFGLWLLFECIGMTEQIISISLFTLPKGHESYHHFVTAVSVFNTVLYTVAGVILTWKPHLVADRVVPPTAKEAESRITATNLMFLAFSLAGLLFLVDGIKGLLQTIPGRLHASEYSFYIPGQGGQSILPPAFETVMGLWLLFGFKRIARGLRRAWRAGRTLGTVEREGDNHDTKV